MNSNDVSQSNEQTKPLDAFDSSILSKLVADARQTYATIGKQVNLSAPAVFARVQRMIRAGVIKGTSAQLSGSAVGKPLLFFVHVDSDGWGKGARMIRLQKFPEVEEMHSVAGDTCLILKVRTADAQAMENFLAHLYAVPGVKGTKSFIALSTYLERPIQAEKTHIWPEPIREHGL